MLNKKEVFHTFLLAVFYGLGVYIFHHLLQLCDIVKQMPENGKLLYWDAGYYNEIATEGYKYVPGKATNTAFYMLFPFIWKILGLSPLGISFLNIVFFAAGIALFTSMYKLSTQQKFMWLTIPSFFICFIPYSEALFMLLMSVAFVGMHLNKRYLVWIGLFLLSMSRPVSMILIPAFLIAEVLCKGNKSLWVALKDFVIDYGLPLIAGQALFVIYEYYVTGIWFVYLKQQAEFWGHKFSLPVLPFNNLYGQKLLWIDALAMFTGFISLLMLIKIAWQWLAKKQVNADKKLVVSFLYLVGVTLTTAFFNPTWATGTTNVNDIHRYVFCSPFFLVFLHHFTISRKYKVWDYVGIVILCNLFWLLFGTYFGGIYIEYFNLCTGVVILYMLNTEKRFEWVPLCITAINFFLQASMFQMFLNGTYPG